MSGVVIECRLALQVMQASDRPQTLHYVDPPYLYDTRTSNKGYRHEMSEADHLELLGGLTALAGSVVLSGYASALYDDALSDWRRIKINTHADGAQPRTEVIWCNFPDQIGLFSQPQEGE